MSTADAPKKPRETDDVPVPATLRKSLKNRHIQLIALGGAIGTGLFYGSSESIALAGPSILLAYLVGGFAIFMIVRALSEMSGRGSEGGRVQLLCHSLLVQARRLHLRLELLVQLHPRLDGGAVRGGQIRKLLVPGDSDLGVGSRIPSGHLRRQSAGRLQVRRVRVLVRHHQDCGRDCHDRRRPGRHHLRSAHRIRHQSELCQLVHLGRGLLPERSHGADQKTARGRAS